MARDRKELPVRWTKLEEQGHERDLEGTTAAERIGMMWPLAVQAWAFMGEDVAESRLPRHVVRVVRRRR
jgi:hypothetical protein